MGFKIDFVIEGGDLIDEIGGQLVYTEKVVVSGNSISDYVCISQNEHCVEFTTRQFEEFIRESLKSSLFVGLREEIAHNEFY